MKVYAETTIPKQNDDYGIFRLHVWRNLYLKFGSVLYDNFHGHAKINPSYPIQCKSNKFYTHTVFTLELNVFTNRELEELIAQTKRDAIAEANIFN